MGFLCLNYGFVNVKRSVIGAPHIGLGILNVKATHITQARTTK